MTAIENMTLSELKASPFCGQNHDIWVSTVICPDYASFIDTLHRAIDRAGARIQANPQHWKDLGEVAISQLIVNSLQDLGFDAKAEVNNGGHCDIYVEHRKGYVWLGEAKIHADYEHLWKGFLQLDTRYATGAYEEDHGGMLIYCRVARLDQVRDRWADAMKEKEDYDFSFEGCTGKLLSFKTEHTNRRLGRKYKLRHFFVSIYYAPEA